MDDTQIPKLTKNQNHKDNQKTTEVHIYAHTSENLYKIFIEGETVLSLHCNGIQEYLKSI